MKLKIDKKNWIPVSFGDVVAERRKTTKDPVTDGLTHIVGLEHIDAESIHLRRFDPITADTTFTKTFQKGDVLFGRRRAYLKKAAQAPFSGICSGDITVMYAKEDLLPELLPFLVNNDKFFDYAVEHSAGGLSPRVKFRDLANYKFLLPPKPEQARLAELLWAGDGVLEKSKRSFTKVELFKDVLLKLLFAKEWDVSTPYLKNFDKSKFEVRSLGSMCQESMFGPRFSSKLYSERGNVASLRTTDIDVSGNINYDTMPKVNIENLSRMSNHILKEGDLLISRSGTCGLTAVFESHILPVLPAAFIIRFRIKNKFSSEYLKMYFNSIVGKHKVDQLASGAVQKNLTSKSLLNVPILVPPIEDQIKITNFIKSLGHDHSSVLRRTRTLQKSLINQIF